MGPIKIGVVQTITSDPFESTPHAKSSSNRQSSRVKFRRFVVSISCDTSNESVPRERNKVLNIVIASKATNAYCIAAAKAKESDQQMEKAFGDAEKKQ